MAIAHMRFSGTRREIGRAQGYRIRALRLPPVSPRDSAFGNRCRAVAARLHPGIEDEFEGMCETSGLPVEEFTSYYFGRTAPAAGGCTNIAVTGTRTRDGHTLVGRNYDWDYADRRWCEARTISPEGEPARIGYTHHWGGLCDVMNDAGLTLCIASLPPEGEPRPGIQWHIAVDLVAATCRTATEAADLLAGLPHVRSLAYLVADRDTARLVETSPRNARVFEPDDGILVGTNTRTDALAGHAETASVRRRRRAEDLLRATKEPVTTDTLIRVLSDHEGGICAGQHGPDAPGGGTIWSLVAEPTPRRVRVAPGHPCDTPFEDILW